MGIKHALIIAISVTVCIQPLEAQVSPVARSSARELVAYFSKKGATREVAKFGGEAGIGKSLDAIAKTGGKKCVEEAAKYASAHGLRALKAIELSPEKIIRALEKTPPKDRKILIHIVNSNKRLISENLTKGSEEFLVLEAKYPGLGLDIFKLGDDVCKIANTLPKSDVLRIAQRSDALLRVQKASPKQYQGFAEALKKTPSKILDTLEKHPKVLLSGTALAAYLGSRNELLNLVGDVICRLSASSPARVGGYGIAAIFCAWLAYKLFRPSSKRRNQE